MPGQLASLANWGPHRAPQKCAHIILNKMHFVSSDLASVETALGGETSRKAAEQLPLSEQTRFRVSLGNHPGRDFADCLRARG